MLPESTQNPALPVLSAADVQTILKPSSTPIQLDREGDKWSISPAINMKDKPSVILPPLTAENLGDPGFKAVYGTKNAY